jgi:hypothetical protein
VRIILPVEKVLRDLLVVSVIRYTFQLRNQCRIPSHWNRYGHPWIERAQGDGLPAAARKASDTQSISIHVRMVIEIVETFTHGEVKQTHSIRSHQIQMGGELVLIFGSVQLTAINPLRA